MFLIKKSLADTQYLITELVTEYCEIFKNSYFEKHLRMAAFEM